MPPLKPRTASRGIVAAAALLLAVCGNAEVVQDVPPDAPAPAAAAACCLRFPAPALMRLGLQTGADPAESATIEVAVEPGPDRAGLRRDSWYFVGYQAATIALLYVMPESVSTWSEEQKEGYSLSQWWHNVREPQIDSDEFYLNYVLHPYWGGAYYVRARERGFDDRSAFWYSALMSATYEFGAEALFEEPSIQDLIVTPVGGALVGRYFVRVRDGIRHRDSARGYRSTGDRWLWVLTDPLGAMNRQVDRLLGRDAQVMLMPGRVRVPMRAADVHGSAGRNAEWAWGIAFSVRW